MTTTDRARPGGRRAGGRGAAGAIVLACALAPAAPSAEGVGYLSGAAGPVYVHDLNARASDGTFQDGGRGFGGGFSAAFGYAFATGPRVEVEALGRFAGGDDNPALAPLLGGTLRQLGAFASAFYDVDTGVRAWDRPLVPYGGIGLGAVGIGAGTGDIETTSAAWQAIIGATLHLQGRLETFADYRFLHAPWVKDTVGDITVDDGLMSHAIMFGVRWRLGAAGERPRVETRPAETEDGTDPDLRWFRTDGTPKLPWPPVEPPRPMQPDETGFTDRPRPVSAPPPPMPMPYDVPIPETDEMPAVDDGPSVAGGPPADPAKRIECRITGDVRVLVAGYCYQMGGDILDRSPGDLRGRR